MADSGEAAWVMPEVNGLVLQQAIKAVSAVTSPVEIDFQISDEKNNQKVLNTTNWAVCAQSPSPGKNISQKTKTVYFFVKRLNEKSCQ